MVNLILDNKLWCDAAIFAGSNDPIPRFDTITLAITSPNIRGG